MADILLYSNNSTVKREPCERGRKTERKRTILILSVVCLVWLEKSIRLDSRHLGSMWPVKQRLLMALHQRKDSISSLAHTFELLFFPLKTKVSSPASDMSPALSITICYGISPLKNHTSPRPLSPTEHKAEPHWCLILSKLHFQPTGINTTRDKDCCNVLKSIRISYSHIAEITLQHN